ncbi:hypothetical protein DPMN_159629 [Dreissena polymorpha]|uniref:Uncharacterized protein n=1 Tax=Dreissena polymorpha TaxID=45954 RepID=A0A9D4EPJ3_DREPO|nr:hypothetical protein DPMN_159629 [Dreissena polymorpha]
MNNKWPSGGNVLQQTGTIFELFHEDPTINVASTVLTRQIFIAHNGRQTLDKRKNAPPPGAHVFQPTIFEIFHDNRTINVASRVLTRKMPRPLATMFHEDLTINVASRVLTRKNAPPLGSHAFQANTNLLTKFHEDWTMNVASRVLIGQMLTPHDGQKARTKQCLCLISN